MGLFVELFVPPFPAIRQFWSRRRGGASRHSSDRDFFPRQHTTGVYSGQHNEMRVCRDRPAIPCTEADWPPVPVQAAKFYRKKEEKPLLCRRGLSYLAPLKPYFVRMPFPSADRTKSTKALASLLFFVSFTTPMGYRIAA